MKGGLESLIPNESEMQIMNNDINMYGNDDGKCIPYAALTVPSDNLITLPNGGYVVLFHPTDELPTVIESLLSAMEKVTETNWFKQQEQEQQQDN